MRKASAIALVAASIVVACSRPNVDPAGTPPTPAAAASSAAGRHCFDVAVSANSPSTKRVFASKGCQGGGVTWAAILAVLVKRRGPARVVETAGWNGEVQDVTWAGGVTRVSIDEEGDASQVCADSASFVAEIQNDVKRLNAQPAELEHAMKEAIAADLECSGRAYEPEP